jgi:hypothetical protein
MDKKILNNIINQLDTDKTELAKVNLALVDDIDKRLNSIKELTKIIETYTDKTLKKFDDINKLFDKQFKDNDVLADLSNKYEKFENNAKKVLAKAEKAAEGLGIKTSEIKGYNKLWDMLDDTKVLSDKAYKESRRLAGEKN